MAEKLKGGKWYHIQVSFDGNSKQSTVLGPFDDIEESRKAGRQYNKDKIKELEEEIEDE